jgi:hypothetical protein
MAKPLSEKLNPACVVLFAVVAVAAITAATLSVFTFSS